MLAWRPGDLTRRYVSGQRASFVSPMALFLFSVFMMFAVFSTIGGPLGNGSSSREAQTPTDEKAEVRRQFDLERSEAARELDGLRVERARLAAVKGRTAEIDGRIQRAEAELAVKERLLGKALALMDGEERSEVEDPKAEKVSAAGPSGKRPPSPARTI